LESRTFLASRTVDAPEYRTGLGQDVSSADEIGIAPVIAGDTSKHRSRAVAPVLDARSNAEPPDRSFRVPAQCLRHGEARQAGKTRAPPFVAQHLRRSAPGGHNRQGLAQRLVLVHRPQVGAFDRQRCQRLLVERSGILPQGAHLDVDGAPVGFEQSADFVALPGSRKVHGQAARAAEHGLDSGSAIRGDSFSDRPLRTSPTNMVEAPAKVHASGRKASRGWPDERDRFADLLGPRRSLARVAAGGP
jgi:hypothetical protein